MKTELNDIFLYYRTLLTLYPMLPKILNMDVLAMCSSVVVA